MSLNKFAPDKSCIRILWPVHTIWQKKFYYFDPCWEARRLEGLQLGYPGQRA